MRTALASLLARSAIGLCPASAPAQVPSGDPLPSTSRVSADNAIDSVVAISVDGLNTDALAKLGTTRTPHLHDLMESGASTLNARTEHGWTGDTWLDPDDVAYAAVSKRPKAAE